MTTPTLFQLPYYYRSLVAVLVFTFSQHIYGQKPAATLGVVTDFKGVRDAFGLIAADFNADGLDDLLTFSHHQYIQHLQGEETLTWQPVRVRVTPTITAIAGADCNRDSYSDLVFMTENPSELQVHLMKPSGASYMRWNTSHTTSADRCLVRDVTNDGKPDILLFGRKESGITVYAGLGNGAYRSPTFILTDLSFSDLEVTDADEDGIQDILGVNWIANEVLLFSGLGRLKFSNPAALTFESEPVMARIASLNGDPAKDLVVMFTDEKTVRTFHGDGYGRFMPHDVLTLAAPPSQMIVADLTGDSKPDIIVLSPATGSLTTWVNDSLGNFEHRRTEFTAGKKPVAIALLTSASSTSADIAVLDTLGNKVHVFFNTNAEIPPSTDVGYALGLQPQGVTIADVDGDSWEDILVANTGSKSISLFLNRGDRTLSGQIPFSQNIPPARLYYVPKNDSIAALISSNPQEDEISITEINAHTFDHRSFTLPTQASPVILATGTHGNGSYLDILVLEGTHTGRVITKFEQVSSSRFIERSVTPPVHSVLLGATVIDSAWNRDPNLAFLTYKKATGRAELFFYGIQDRSFSRTMSRSFSLSTESAPTALLWSADLNDDGKNDLILNTRNREQSILIALRENDTLFSTPHFRLETQIAVTSPDHLKVADLNGDGIQDIVLENTLRNTIVAFFGKGDGTFLPRVRLMSSKEIAAFAIGDLYHDGYPELIIVDSEAGLLRIISLEE